MAALNTRLRTQNNNQALAPQQNLVVSPALDAMRQSTTSQTGPRVVDFINKAANAAPNAQTTPAVDPGPPQVQAAQVDMTASNAATQGALGENQKWMDQARKDAELYTNNMVNKGANSAARMGLAAGGASYLSGARTAATQGYNNLQTQMGLGAKNASSIYTGQAGLLAGAAGTDASNQTSANVANTGRQWQIDDSTAVAEATQMGNQAENYVTNAQMTLKNSYGIDVAGGKGATNAKARDLTNAVTNATPGSPEQKAAQQQLDAYISKLAQAEQARRGQGNIPQQFLQGSKPKDMQSQDAWFKLLERNGYFN